MNKHIFSTLTVSLSIMSAAAQETYNANDTVASDLQEIVIEAPKVIRKPDMDVYYPSKSAVDNSKNGIQIISNLMIPTLTVNEALGQIKTSDGAVQIRINGRVASVEQLKTLLPENIKRVEWIDDPGLRYAGANSVLNFIITNPTLGGSTMLSAMPVLNAAWGQYNADVKLNNGRSQWQLYTYYKLTNRFKSYRDYDETFTWPDGKTLTREEKPIDGHFDNTYGAAFLSYSYIKPDTTTFYVSMGTSGNFSDNSNYTGDLTLSDGSENILLTDNNHNKNITPQLSLYLEQQLGHRQTLVVDFGTSYFGGHTGRDYIEKLKLSDKTVTDVHTSIRDRNMSYGLEADYIKKWKKSRLTAGVSYTANRNRSQYDNIGGEVYHQSQDKVYFFGEYFQSIRKVSVTAGIGAQYNDIQFRESPDRGSHSWNLRPRLSLNWRPNSVSRFRLNFTSWQTTPTLSQTNGVAQQIDGFQWRVGNPDLKTYSNFRLMLRYDFNLPIINGTLGVRGDTSPDAITSNMKWEGDHLVSSYENSHGRKALRIWFAPQIEVIPSWFILSGSLQYDVARTQGDEYIHTYHDWSGEVSAMVTHWGFILTASYNKASKNLYGETVSWGESISLINLAYNLKEWQFAAGMIMPFGKYDQGHRSLNKWNLNEEHMRIKMRMPYIQISYNLQWGRQKRGVNKIINADSSADSSSAARR